MDNDEKKISRSDIVKYSQMFTERIHIAQVLYTEGNYWKFNRCVDILADSLLEPELGIMETYISNLNEKNEIKRRRKILKKTIKTISHYLREPEIEDKGFLEK